MWMRSRRSAGCQPGISATTTSPPRVTEVLCGTYRRRTENERWLLFRSHYGFDAFYCQPGIDGAHEKGGITGDTGRFRRQHLSPMPVADSLSGTE